MENNMFFEGGERKLLRDNRTVLLYGEIESCLVEDFVTDLHLIMLQDSNEPITIIISSGGGEFEPAIACMRAIGEAQKNGLAVIGKVYGHAQSAAFLILQCCDVRVMGKFCILMAHGITWGSHGDLKDAEAESKLINFWKDEFAGLVASRCNDGVNDKKYWELILKEKTPNYYTSDEAIKIGLIDDIE